MDLGRAISEPFVRLIAFHNAFNLNVKFVYGALASLNSADATTNRFTLPNGGEPWGDKISWSNMDAAVREAAAFISEMGVVRSTSSFEDYVTGVTAELDRATARVTVAAELSPKSVGEESDGNVPQLQSLVSRLNLSGANMAADLALVEFFQIARNCVVHRSGRASRQLAEVAQSERLTAALATWPRRKGKWAIAIPDIQEGEPVPWLPRHAIMASACHHRFASAIDAAAITAMGTDGIVAMAAHWAFLAENAVPCPAKLDAQTMVRTQLVQRYLVRHVTLSDVVQSLRVSQLWDKTRDEFSRLGLRRARDERRSTGSSRQRR